jgi:hypothetical protein
LLLAALAGIVLLGPAAQAESKLIAEAVGDINGDGVKDRAQLVLANDDGDVDLAIYVSAGRKLPARPTLVKHAFGWSGDNAGQIPDIKFNARGSILVGFGNDAAGRDRWHSQYTIAWRNGALVVAGYSHTERDTLNPDAGGGCDIDFLTGKGQRNLKPVTVPAHAVALADWSDKSIPKACKFDD